MTKNVFDDTIYLQKYVEVASKFNILSRFFRSKGRNKYLAPTTPPAKPITHAATYISYLISL